MRHDYDAPSIIDEILDKQPKQKMIPLSVLEDIKYQSSPVQYTFQP